MARLNLTPPQFAETLKSLYSSLNPVSQDAYDLAVQMISQLVNQGVLTVVDPDQPHCRVCNAPDPVQPVQPAQDPRRAKLRAAIVRKVWEPGLRSELVDRIVDLVASGAVPVHELKHALRDAVERRDLFNVSNGRFGREKAWHTLGTWCKAVYLRAGRTWTPTAPDLEPAPDPDPAHLRLVRTLDADPLQLTTTADGDDPDRILSPEELHERFVKGAPQYFPEETAKGQR